MIPALCALAALDAIVFGLILTRQRWGSAKQHRPWASRTGFWKDYYHLMLGAVQYGTAAALYLYDPVQGLALFVALLCAAQDSIYHVLLGHFLPRSGWHPFSAIPHDKPTNVPFLLIAGGHGPRRQDTALRLVGLLAASSLLI